jgi:hypothetical protein
MTIDSTSLNLKKPTPASPSSVAPAAMGWRSATTTRVSALKRSTPPTAEPRATATPQTETGFPHDIKGQGIYCYVTLKVGVQPTEALRQELVQQVRKEIGPFASPDIIQWAPGLPKTRSGKIMRRILRKIAENELGNLGDTTTLADPSVVDDLVKNRAAK